MLFLRKILFLTFIISLSFSGVANASMECCKMQRDIESSSMQMDEPCHEEGENEANNKDDACTSCDCQHCISKVFLMSPSKDTNNIEKAVKGYVFQPLISQFPDKYITPPKRIS